MDEFQPRNLLALVGVPVGSAIACSLLIFFISCIAPPSFLGKVAILQLISIFSVMRLIFVLYQSSAIALLSRDELVSGIQTTFANSRQAHD